MTTLPIRKARICNHCNTSDYPSGKPILSDDKSARMTNKGDWICGTCIDVERKQKLVKDLGPVHPYTKRFMEEEDRRVNTWNKLADKVNNPNIMKRKSNRYW